ncbi:HlyD family secretion protein [Tautonia sociabilis]|uniref:HlyD family efflux transporter periplasmic adaptor subunit n=1 Tax=Tautonia sociabilis TaxID=2080755 RepID=A0A432MMR6_9BACT|nr:HlyD family efflux transporter periplasmic adaptor subunit [Tautonia sociabilis]RUL88590.1 HlyD family efflux transporter periplasmic adaptor subunit [Tautonia sociabilis]
MSLELSRAASVEAPGPSSQGTPGEAPPRRLPVRRPPAVLAPVRSGTSVPAVRAFDAGSGMPALRQVGTPRAARKVGVALMVALLGLPFVLALVPWRQSVFGDGSVIGYHPLDRQFQVEAPISGRVISYAVIEGDQVRRGDLIATVKNVDPRYLETLRSQEENYQAALEQATQAVAAYTAALRQKEAERDQAILEAEAGILEAERKVQEAEQKVAEAQTDASGYQILYEQAKALYERGLEAGQAVVKAEQTYRTAERKLDQAREQRNQAQAALEQAKAKRKVVEAKAQAEIEKARTDIQTAEMKVQEARVKLTDTQVKIRQQEQGGRVLAPRAGTVLRLLTNVGEGAYVKEGDPLAILVPETPRLAAELYLPGRDIPLVRVGDPVRLQFEGWPALQFIGWPAAAVGTFPGKVALVDPTTTKGGKFRVLAVPDLDGPELRYRERQGGPFAPGTTVTGLSSGQSGTIVAVKPDEKDPRAGVLVLERTTGEFLPDEPIASSGETKAVVKSPWPSRRFLRQGARANGWVLLREVPLGYEIWRRLNGFAPVVAQDEPELTEGDGAGKDDKPKLKRPK